MGRRRSSVIEDIFEIGAKLPRWLSLIAAGGSYLLFHNLAQIDPGASTGLQDIGNVMVRQMLRTIAHFAQFVVPLLLLTGAAISLLKGIQRAVVYDSATGSRGLFKRKTKVTLDSLSWRQFEHLIHEYFRRKGFTVAETASGADGGIDLRIRNADDTATVQCKHCRSKKVDVRIVREQLGVMLASGASECFVVTSGKFTDEARKFAKGQPVTLIDGEELRALLGIVVEDDVKDERIRQGPALPCPSCASDMKLRTARRGRNSGGQFWGCSRFPGCRGTREIVR